MELLTGLGEAVEVKFIGIPLPVDFRHDVLVVIIAQSAAQLIVIHVRLANNNVLPAIRPMHVPLTLAPLFGHLVRIDQLELPVSSFPCDAVGIPHRIRQQLQQELP